FSLGLGGSGHEADEASEDPVNGLDRSNIEIEYQRPIRMLPRCDNSNTLYPDKHTAYPNECASPAPIRLGRELRIANKIDAFGDRPRYHGGCFVVVGDRGDANWFIHTTRSVRTRSDRGNE